VTQIITIHICVTETCAISRTTGTNKSITRTGCSVSDLLWVMTVRISVTKRIQQPICYLNISTDQIRNYE